MTIKEQVLRLKADNPDWGYRKIAKVLGVTRDVVRGYIKREAAKANPENGAKIKDHQIEKVLLDACGCNSTFDSAQYQFEQKSDSATLTVRSEKITTVEDAIAYAEIDMDRFEIEWSRVNSYEMPIKTDDGIRQVTNWQVTVKFKPKITSNDDIFLGAFEEIAKSWSVNEKGPLIRSSAYSDDIGELCAVVNMPDVHMGKYCWGEQTGNDYDLDTAAVMALDAVEQLAVYAEKRGVSRIIFPVGSDYMHVDNLDKATSAGTRQDVDDRIGLIFRVGLDVLVRSINILSEIAPVQVLGIPGNHDDLSSQHLATALYYIFSGNKFVEVDDEIKTRKCRRWHNNLLCFMHGTKSEPRMQNLGQITASEWREDAAATHYWHWFLNHLHKPERHLIPLRESDTHIIINRISSLSGTDAWHYQHGYINVPRFAQTLYYNPDCYDGEDVSKVVEI